jgi:cardiolipin synthase (CMP-forming)
VSVVTPADGPDGEDRILTVPNLITLGRLACLPLYLWLLLGLEDRVSAALLLGALGATDWVDGYIARHFHQVSNLGKVIDPVADRFLFFVGIAGIIAVDGAPLWFSVVVLAREVLVGATTVIIAILGARRIDVTWFGKAGTFGLMFSFPLFLGGTSDVGFASVLWVLGWLSGIPGLVLSLYAAALYAPMAVRAVREGRSQRAGVRPAARGR